jgi:hypothetical protein
MNSKQIGFKKPKNGIQNIMRMGKKVAFTLYFKNSNI